MNLHVHTQGCPQSRRWTSAPGGPLRPGGRLSTQRPSPPPRGWRAQSALHVLCPSPRGLASPGGHALEPPRKALQGSRGLESTCPKWFLSFLHILLIVDYQNILKGLQRIPGWKTVFLLTQKEAHHCLLYSCGAVEKPKALLDSAPLSQLFHKQDYSMVSAL